MWRILSAIRGVRRKFCENYRTCQSGAYNEDEKSACTKNSVLSLTDEPHNEGFNDHKHNPKRRTCHTHHYKNPFDVNFNCFLEGVRTGSAILFGLQLLYNRLKYRYGDNNEKLLESNISNTLQHLLVSLSLPQHGRLAILPETSNEFPDIPSKSSGSKVEVLETPTEKLVSSTLNCEATEESIESIDSLDDWFRNSPLESTNSVSSAESYSDQQESHEDAFVATCHEVENAVNACAAELQNQFGIQLIQSKRYKEALQHFEASCALGDSKACFNLGICHELGLGTKQDFVKACDCYQKAAEKGHGSALYNLGVYYMEGRENIPKEESKALRLLKTAAQKGVIEAQRFMGVHFIQKGEMQEAVTYLKSAVKSKDVDSQYYLGVCYENGWGVEENSAKAAEMYSLAATGNQVDALYNLATFHELGLGGLPSNKTTAIELLQKASSLGHEISSVRLKHLKESHLHDESKMKDLRTSSSPELHLCIPSDKRIHLSRKVQSESLFGRLTGLFVNSAHQNSHGFSETRNYEPIGHSYSMGSNSTEIAIFT